MCVQIFKKLFLLHLKICWGFICFIQNIPMNFPHQSKRWIHVTIRIVCFSDCLDGRWSYAGTRGSGRFLHRFSDINPPPFSPTTPLIHTIPFSSSLALKIEKLQKRSKLYCNAWVRRDEQSGKSGKFSGKNLSVYVSAYAYRFDASNMENFTSKLHV